MLSPLTGLPNTYKIRAVRPDVISERWRQELNIDVGDQFRSIAVIEQWRCNATGFEWYEPPTSAGTSALYAQLQKYDWYYMPDKWEFSAALNYFSKGSRVLEVGVGFGYFLNAAHNSGLNVSGVEFNPAAAAAARKAGFTVFEDNLNVLAEKLGATFDGVCAFQVLEHVPDPMPFLQDMLGVLRQGGKLVLSVPNTAVSKVIDPERLGLLDQPPHHLSYWDENVFRALEKLLPVKVVEVKREPLQPYHVSWFVSEIGWKWRRRLGIFFGRLLVNRLSIALSSRLLKLGLRKFIPGHTLFVVLEKTSRCQI